MAKIPQAFPGRNAVNFSAGKAYRNIPGSPRSGTHGIRAYDPLSPPSVRLVLNTEAGKVYFLRFYVRGTARSGATDARLHPVSAEEGRSLVAQGQLYP